MTDQRRTNSPSKRQLGLLRTLAMERGQTFATPQTSADATREIRRLMGHHATPRADVRRERSQISRDRAQLSGGAAAVQSRELEGYGSTAGWANANTPLLVVTHTAAEGTLLDGTVAGDGAAPILRRHGLRWSADLQRWFVPNSRGQQAGHDLLTRLEQALRVYGFEVQLPGD
jgi:hypothetical protein